EPLILRSPHARRERRARAQRAQAASVVGDPRRGLKPDEETRAVRGSDAHGLVALAADPERQPLALRRLRMHADLRNLHEATLVRKRWSCPREPEDVDRLLDSRLAMVGRRTSRLCL